MSIRGIRMRKPSLTIPLFIFFIILSIQIKAQPVPLEAFYLEEMKIPNYLLNTGRPTDICLFNNGRVFFHNGRYIFEKKGNSIEPVAGQGSGGISEGIDFMTGSNGIHLWAVSGERFYLYNKKFQSFERHNALVKSDTLRALRWKVAPWQKKLLIAAQDSTVYLYNPANTITRPFYKFPANSMPPFRVLELEGDHALLGSANEWLLVESNGSVRTIAKFKNPVEMQTATILQRTWLYVWTITAELYRIHLPTGRISKEKIGTPVVRPLGTIGINGVKYAVLGGTDSTYLFQPETGTRFTWHGNERQKGAKLKGGPGSMAQDIYGRVWFTSGQSIFWFDAPLKTFQPAFSFLDQLPETPINSIEEPKEITVSKFHPLVFFTAANTLYIYDTLQKQIAQKAELPVEKGLSFINLQEINENEWIISANQGFYLYNKQSNRFIPVTYQNEPILKSYAEVVGDQIYIRDRSRNLYKMTIKPLVKPEKVATDSFSIYTMCRAGEDRLIAITDKGIAYFTPGTGRWSLLSTYQKMGNPYAGS
ncbi:MAG: hypothetical protein MUE71_11025 [Chitinophagaceae bacterium]|nr:hypothetical protein [Chitinophagaceae bacterium]